MFWRLSHYFEPLYFFNGYFLLCCFHSSGYWWKKVFVWDFSLPLPPCVEETSSPTKKCICINTCKNAFKIWKGFTCHYFVMFIRQFFRGELVNKSLVLKFMVKCLFSFFKVPGSLCNLTVQERMDSLLRKIMEEYSRLKALQTQLMAESKQVNFYSIEYRSIWIFSVSWIPSAWVKKCLKMCLCILVEWQSKGMIWENGESCCPCHRIVGWLRLGDTSAVRLIQPLTQS